VSDEAAARRLAEMLREGSDSPRPGPSQDPELARLLATVNTLERPGRARSRRWPWIAAAAAVVAATLMVLVFARRDLTYEVQGMARVEARSVAAESSEAVHLRFSDGSTFQLSPGAQVRVGESTADGSELALVRGAISAKVVHRARSRWSVAAGPFQVVVVGTRFDARWDSEARRVSVELHEGAVEVKGGGLSEPVVVRSGQRLEAGTARDDWRLTPLSSKALPPAEPAPSASETVVVEAPPPVAPAPAASASWPALLSRSEFATIVAQAEAMGIDRCLTSCSPANLRALADAARYTGKFELAERSLLSLRRRSPAQAAAAGFFLGRLYESRGRSSEALRMYEGYLRESPRGDYAKEAAAGRDRTRR
jgi:hypothetical protein